MMICTYIHIYIYTHNIYICMQRVILLHVEESIVKLTDICLHTIIELRYIPTDMDIYIYTYTSNVVNKET